MARPPSLFLLALAVGAAACGSDDFGEGFRTDEGHRREVFTQVEPAPVDVLWVVDTSCSMADEQEKLAEHFPAFIDFFVTSGLEFKMAVTDTDVNEVDTDEGLDGHFSGDPAILTPETPDLEAAFVEAALMGITPHHDDERGLHAAWTSLETLAQPGGWHATFLREDANLSVIVLSDEPDYSTLGEADSGTFIDDAEFASWIENKKGDPGRAALSGIVGIGDGGIDDPAGCNLPDNPQDGQGWGQGALRGDGYLEAIGATGGLAASICDEDWVELLARLGLLVAGLEDSFVLRDVPEIGSLSVEVEGALGSGWEYDPASNAVRFTESRTIPRPGMAVEVTYRVVDAP